MKMLFLSILAASVLLVLYLQLPMFSKLPHGDRLTKIEKSPNYKNEKFCLLAPMIGKIIQLK